MKKILLTLMTLVCALCCALGFVACNDEPEGAIPEAEWGQSIEAFFNANGATGEVQLFAAHYDSFKYEDGKYVASEIPSTDGFVCKNIEITLLEGKIVKITYELRTESLDTPDRIITVDQNGVSKTDVPKPSDNTQMSEDEWGEQTATFGALTNYSLERIRNGGLVGAMKLDGTKYYETTGSYEGIYTIENSLYYSYIKQASSSEWIKSNTKRSRYESVVAVPVRMVAAAAAALETNFSSFAFSAGVYTASEIAVASYDVTLKDVVITVSGKKIVRVVCTLVGGYDERGDERITVDHIGSTEVLLPAVYTDDTAPSDGEMSQTQWESCFTALGASRNFTQTTQNKNVLNIYKVDVNTDYREGFGTYYESVIYTREGDDYIQYTKPEGAASLWQKETCDEATYEDGFMSSSLVGLAAAVFGAHYNDFSYASGVYTAAQVKYSGSTNIEDVEIVVSGTNVVSISCYISYYGDITIDHFGSTEIELPETQPNLIPSVAGKTFDYLCAGSSGLSDDGSNLLTSTDLAPVNTRLSGSRYVFNADGTVQIYEHDIAHVGSYVESGTYTENNGTISITVTQITIDEDGKTQSVELNFQVIYDGLHIIRATNDNEKTICLFYAESEA